MKRLICIITCFLFLLTLCSCSGSYEDGIAGAPDSGGSFDSLDPEVQMMLFDKGWTKEQFDSISQQERDQAVKCIAL